jgi:leucyl/phenylalanyl-tRNA--protein transferase
MAEERDGPIGWYSPDPRAIIPLDRFRISRSLRRVLRRGTFSIRVDTAFEDVIRACADREETWISEEIIGAYVQLFDQGFGHSVESWKDGALAGGLYGVAIGGAFFGESMFSLVTDASKVALAALVEMLRKGGFSLLDTQFLTSHLQQFGTIEVGRQEYLALLEGAVREDVRFPGATGCAPAHADTTPL